MTLLFVLTVLTAPAPKSPVGGEQGPIDFRCDGMQIFSKPNRVECKGNVVVRRRDILLCCETFEGFGDEKWQWEKFTCSGDVRGQRPDELMESDFAVFVLGTNDLVLTGRPRLQRGKSLLAGERILVNVKTNQAQIEKPRGRIEQADTEINGAALPAQTDETQLPATCTVPRIQPPRTAATKSAPTGSSAGPTSAEKAAAPGKNAAPAEPNAAPATEKAVVPGKTPSAKPE